MWGYHQMISRDMIQQCISLIWRNLLGDHVHLEKCKCIIPPPLPNHHHLHEDYLFAPLCSLSPDLPLIFLWCRSSTGIKFTTKSIIPGACKFDVFCIFHNSRMKGGLVEWSPLLILLFERFNIHILQKHKSRLIDCSHIYFLFKLVRV